MVSKADIPAKWLEPSPLDQYQQEVIDTTPDKVHGAPGDYTVGEPAVTVSCGPNLRFLASREDGQNNYRGTILLVTRGNEQTPEITYVIGPSSEAESLNKGSFPSECIYQEGEYSFWRYTMSLELTNYEQKVWYSVNGEFRDDFQFYLPSVDQSMNIMSYSCNGFSLGTDTSTFKGSMWLEVLRRHDDFHYHVMLGGGDQIYCDSIKLISKEFQKWLKHKTAHSKWKLTNQMVQDFDNYYLNHYMEWFGKGYMKITKCEAVQSLFPVAMHRIPSINLFDDHDIIDGFGSYKHLTMDQDIFKGVGNSAFKYYMLFQQHTLPSESPSKEPSWIPGSTIGPYINDHSRSIYARLGKEIAFLGLDCRTERTKHQIATGHTYDSVFARLEQEIKAAPDVKHLLVLLGVPIMYPRMVWAEVIMESKLIGPVKWLAQKGLILKGLVNEFDGSIELLDDLNDHWCAVNHKLERNRFVKRLMEFGAEHAVRITILSGDVHLCCMSRFRTSSRHHEEVPPPNKDPRLMVNLISSAIVNTPPPNGMASMLEKRAKIHHYDKNTSEDMIPLFLKDTDGSERSNELFQNRRNFADLILGKNLPKQDVKAFTKFQRGDLIYPGPTSDPVKVAKTDPSKESKINGQANVGYPLDPDSLVAQLHVEVDRSDVNSKSYGYQMLIPTLDEKSKLETLGRLV